jgi:hypothetical protein
MKMDVSVCIRMLGKRFKKRTYQGASLDIHFDSHRNTIVPYIIIDYWLVIQNIYEKRGKET